MTMKFWSDSNQATFIGILESNGIGYNVVDIFNVVFPDDPELVQIAHELGGTEVQS